MFKTLKNLYQDDYEHLKFLDIHDEVLSPFDFAAREGSFDIVKYLSETVGVDVYSHIRKSPLYYAAEHSNLEIIRLLFNKANLEYEEGAAYEITPLYAASMNGFLEIVRLLLENTIGDMNPEESNEGTTPLHWAAEAGNLEVAKLLLEYNIDLETLPKDLSSNSVTHSSRKRSRKTR